MTSSTVLLLTQRYIHWNLYANLGILPRPEGKWDDVPLPMPEWNHAKMDNWTAKKALFGQNDYIGTF